VCVSCEQDWSWWTIWSQGRSDQLHDDRRSSHVEGHRDVLQHSDRGDADERRRPYLRSAPSNARCRSRHHRHCCSVYYYYNPPSSVGTGNSQKPGGPRTRVQTLRHVLYRHPLPWSIVLYLPLLQSMLNISIQKLLAIFCGINSMNNVQNASSTMNLIRFY